MDIKVEAAPRMDLLAATAGDTLDGYPLKWSLPGDPQAVVTLPDELTPAEIDRIVLDWHARGVVVDDGRGLWRPEHTDYRPLWLADSLVWGDAPDRPLGMAGMLPHAVTSVGPLPLYAVGDTFALHGVTAGTRRRGRDGAGVCVAIVDTGVDRAHEAFDQTDFLGDGTDGQGHGTHVAATAASRWGVASQATILSKIALPNGQGTETTVARAIRDAADMIVQRRQPGVISMSLGGSVSSIIDAAVQYARQRNVLTVAAAGNTPSAAIGSPARVSDLVVLAVTRGRAYADFTSGRSWPTPNRCSAMGVDIVSAASGTRSGTLSASGTSMAAPHVSGLAALLMAGGMARRQVAAALGG